MLFVSKNVIYFFANNQDKEKRKKYINLAEKNLADGEYQ